MGQYFVSTYITLVGYPFVVALPSGIFSRVLGNIPQVKLFSILMATHRQRYFYITVIELHLVPSPLKTRSFNFCRAFGWVYLRLVEAFQGYLDRLQRLLCINIWEPTGLMDVLLLYCY